MKTIVVTLLSIFILSCAGEQLSDPTPKDKLIYPVITALSKDESKLFVANTNFDLRYRGASILVIDLESNKILPEETKLTDSFLSDIKIDYENELLFTVSKNNTKLYAYDLSQNSPYLSCNEDKDGNCDKNHILELNNSTPAVLETDPERKLIYIGYKSGPIVSAVSYEKSDDKLKLKLLTTFKLKDIKGNITDIFYDKDSDKVYVATDYSKYLASFRPLRDYYGNISKIKFFPMIKVTNRALLVNSRTNVENIVKKDDKLLLSLSNPSSISILTPQELYGEQTFTFENSVYTDYFPAQTLCLPSPSSICLSSLYDSKNLAIWDINNEIPLYNLNIKKRVYSLTYSEKRKEIYVTLFIDNAIMVINADENSKNFLKIKNLIY